MSKYFDSIQSFAKNEDGSYRIFRFWVYRLVYTPYEIKQLFTDESIYEDTYARFGMIKEVVNLHDDILLGFAEVYEGNDFEEDEDTAITYYPLSRIVMSYYDKDNVPFDYEEEEDENYE